MGGVQTEDCVSDYVLVSSSVVDGLLVMCQQQQMTLLSRVHSLLIFAHSNAKFHTALLLSFSILTEPLFKQRDDHKKLP